MILLYHKIAEESPTEWWVTANTFYRHLVQLSGKKVVYLDDYDPNDPKQVVITFDGIYDNVLKFAAPLLKKFNYPFELFVTSDYVGKSNEFDSVEPATTFCNEEQLQELVSMGGRLQWHTRTHRDITKIPEDEIEAELTVPEKLKKLDKNGFKWFGYAYGEYNKTAQDIVEKKFRGGLACENGTFDDKTIWPRQIIQNNTNLIDEKVSVIIPCYNYGHFLAEAIESVLRQTYKVDEILLSDDASTDHSYSLMRSYQKKHPSLIKLNRNEENIGIEKHFNKAVKKTSGSLVVFLGADNRFPSNYIENCLVALLSDEKVAISYTDFALFGNRAEKIYETYSNEYKGGVLCSSAYLIIFPEFTPQTKKFLLNKGNFIHGSSMYRRAVYEEVGGYASRSAGPEDYSLFQRMISAGWSAKKAPNTYLEYRQHSLEQANMQFAYFTELNLLRDEVKRNYDIIDSLETELAELRPAKAELDEIKRSKAWRTIKRYRQGVSVAKHPSKLKKLPKKLGL